MGRKPILTDKIIEEAATLLAEGHYAITICDYLGIDQGTWYNWILRGEEVRDAETDEIAEAVPNYRLYFKFVTIIKASEAQAEMQMVKHIRSAAITSWQAAAWYLERKHRDRWGRIMQTGSGDTKALDDFLTGLKALAREGGVDAKQDAEELPPELDS